MSYFTYYLFAIFLFLPTENHIFFKQVCPSEKLNLAQFLLDSNMMSSDHSAGVAGHTDGSDLCISATFQRLNVCFSGQYGHAQTVLGWSPSLSNGGLSE